MCELGWVANDGTSPFGIAECAPDHDMDLVDGLYVEAAAPIAPALLEQGGVETIEVLGSEVPKGHTAHMGEHMELDEASITIPGARSKRELLGRQPLHREIHAQGWTNSPSVYALTLGGSEGGRELLGLLRSVPAGCHRRRSRPVIGSIPS